jgi:hypothetical protein
MPRTKEIVITYDDLNVNQRKKLRRKFAATADFEAG